MQVVFHLGAHCTDEDRLLRSLLQNGPRLAKDGIAVPGPSRYRGLLENAVQKLRGQAASEETREVMFETLLDDDSADRIILSFENFMCVPSRVFENGQLYERAAVKPKWLRELFKGHAVEFALAVRNPATFVPALLKHPRQNHQTLADMLQGADPRTMRWSQVVATLRENNPDCPIIAWANEDTPLLWPQIMREVAGLDPQERLKGGLNVAGPIMSREGLKKLRAYLTNHPPKSEIQRRRVLAAFLDKFAIEDEVEEEIDLPGWDAAVIDELTQAYEDDLHEIARLPGVNFLAP